MHNIESYIHRSMQQKIPPLHSRLVSRFSVFTPETGDGDREHSARNVVEVLVVLLVSDGCYFSRTKSSSNP